MDSAAEASVAAAFAAVRAELGPVGVLINNAGIARKAPPEALDLEAWNAVVAVNMTGVFLCARAAARPMLPAGGGSTVNISSPGGHVGRGFPANPPSPPTTGA